MIVKAPCRPSVPTYTKGYQTLETKGTFTLKLARLLAGENFGVRLMPFFFHIWSYLITETRKIIGVGVTEVGT